MSNLKYGIYQPVRFVEDLALREVVREGFEEEQFELYCPTTHVLPFQIKKQADFFGIDAVMYRGLDGAADVDIEARFAADELHLVNLTGSDYIIHMGQTALTTPVPEGKYYIEVESNGKFWYSKTITVIDFDFNLLIASCIKTKFFTL